MTESLSGIRDSGKPVTPIYNRIQKTVSLREILEEFRAKIEQFNHSVLRDIALSDVANKIKVAIGMR